ncbi:MAG: hypothetical protein IPJ41_17500 [Phycisphaerales bacterium]|nr:hypothetical protein [Phycisphaerales bacterium]
MAIGLTAVLIPPLLAPRLIGAARAGWERSSRDDLARSAVPAQFQVLAIVRGALAEGLGLLCTVAVMLTGQVAFFAGTGLALILMMATFPTADRWREFHRRVTGEELPLEP